ncbi:hypothetical protein [Occultella gossypii]|uniref:Uncharacterized protein n=1 Tax=Occultella gossypii TaxID=2800820 RepID=A0ABS7SDL9_9MICO|nr:hypothetical protein [Occultella gossypii]MBZ2197378.1 hypothetical protein [Occultella gossypii]
MLVALMQRRGERILVQATLPATDRSRSPIRELPVHLVVSDDHVAIGMDDQLLGVFAPQTRLASDARRLSVLGVHADEVLLGADLHRDVRIPAVPDDVRRALAALLARAPWQGSWSAVDEATDAGERSVAEVEAIGAIEAFLVTVDELAEVVARPVTFDGTSSGWVATTHSHTWSYHRTSGRLRHSTGELQRVGPVVELPGEERVRVVDDRGVPSGHHANQLVWGTRSTPTAPGPNGLLSVADRLARRLVRDLDPTSWTPRPRPPKAPFFPGHSTWDGAEPLDVPTGLASAAIIALIRRRGETIVVEGDMPLGAWPEIQGDLAAQGAAAHGHVIVTRDSIYLADDRLGARVLSVAQDPRVPRLSEIREIETVPRHGAVYVIAGDGWETTTEPVHHEMRDALVALGKRCS